MSKVESKSSARTMLSEECEQCEGPYKSNNKRLKVDYAADEDCVTTTTTESDGGASSPAEEEQLPPQAVIHQMQLFDPYLFMSRVPPRHHFEQDLSRITLNEGSIPPFCGKRIGTLVLDLDETLVHSSIAPVEGVDFQFPVDMGDRSFMVYAKKRPHCDDFLKRAAKYFEIVVFTASKRIYADQVLDFVDPDGLISHRVFREHCYEYGGVLLKDLGLLNRDLRKTVIVDNSPQTFAFHIDNGIPIESWFHNPQDDQLLHLMHFLERLAVDHSDDFRPVLRAQFRLRDIVSRYVSAQDTD